MAVHGGWILRQKGLYWGKQTYEPALTEKMLSGSSVGRRVSDRWFCEAVEKGGWLSGKMGVNSVSGEGAQWHVITWSVCVPGWL